MTFTAAGALVNAENSVAGTSTTFPVTTLAAGDFIVAEFACNTSFVSAVASSRVTWAQLAPATGASSFTANAPFFSSVWLGTVNSAGSDVVTVTFAASMGGGNCRLDAREFRSSAGSVSLDAWGTVNAGGGTSSWATLTPSGAGRLYWGWCENLASGVAGSTPGFTYENDAHGNCSGYCLNVSSAYTPAWGDSAQAAGVMVLLSEGAAGAPVTGSGALAGRKPAAAGSGSEAFTGPGGLTAKKPAAFGAGAEGFAGAASLAGKKPAASGTGSAAGAPVTGSGALVRRKPAAAGSGSEAFTGAGTVARRKPLAAGTGAYGAAGSGSISGRKAAAAGTGSAGAPPPFTVGVLTASVSSGGLTAQAAAPAGAATVSAPGMSTRTSAPANVTSTGSGQA